MWWVAILVFVGCGDDAPPSRDGGPVDARAADGGDAGTGPSPVTPPARVDLAPCPDGWRPIEDPRDVAETLCDPWPEGGPADCAPGYVQRPGEDDCVLLGTACPVDGWPIDLPSSGVIYVRAGESGTGTRADPFGSIEAAHAMAAPGDTIAVAPGAYPEPLTLTTSVDIRGACPAVVLGGASSPTGFVVGRADASLENLTIAGVTQAIEVAGGTLTLSDVLIDDVSEFAIDVVGASLVASDLSIRRVFSDPLRIRGGGTVLIERAHIDDVGDGIRLFQGQLDLSSSVVRVVASDIDDPDLLVVAEPSTVATLRSVVFESTASSRIFVFVGATLQATDFRLIGPAATTVGELGGVVALEGSTLVLERAYLERTRAVGVGAAGVGTRVVATNLVVRDVEQTATAPLGHALEVSAGASGSVDRLGADRASAVAVLVDGAGTALELRDAIVEDVRPGANGFLGRALHAQNLSTVSAERLTVVRAREVGVVSSTGSTVTIDDAVVRETLPRACADEGSCPPAGIGVAGYAGGVLSLRRFRIEDNHLAGIQIAADGQVDLVDGRVSGQPVGANVQVPGYDLGRLTDRVYFEDNGVNLDSESLPVPDPVIPR